ncbi:hypothetical protein GQ600_8680 [Phytophthora cactorum]|nr:hypothetical protein GQ600_8680 [Phytophthora cactorum]
MRLHRVLLLTVVTLVASNSALVATEETSVSVLKHVAVSDRDGNQMRSLRFATTSDEKDKVAGMTNKEILAELKKIQNTQEFQRYKRYAAAFDDHMINMFGSGYNRPTEFFDKNSTPLEKMARAQVWAETSRDKQYVKEFLGLLRANQKELKDNQYYQYYL